MVGCQLWTAYAPCGSQHKDAVQITLEQIDLIKRFIEQYSTNLHYVTSSAGRNVISYSQHCIVSLQLMLRIL